MSPTELSRAITNGDWALTKTLAEEHPKQAGVWSRREGFFDGGTLAKVLPLHEALVAGAPLDVIATLVRSCPRSVMETETSYHRLPLHCACRKHADPEVIRFLILKYKAACLETDSMGRVPLHYALTNGAEPEVIQLLMDASPGAARAVDNHGWSPVHVAMSVGASEEVVRLLLDANPEAALSRTEKGASLRGCIPKLCPHRDELKHLAEEAREEIETKIHLPDLHEKQLKTMHSLV